MTNEIIIKIQFPDDINPSPIYDLKSGQIIRVHLHQIVGKLLEEGLPDTIPPNTSFTISKKQADTIDDMWSFVEAKGWDGERYDYTYDQGRPDFCTVFIGGCLDAADEKPQTVERTQAFIDERVCSLEHRISLLEKTAFNKNTPPHKNKIELVSCCCTGVSIEIHRAMGTRLAKVVRIGDGNARLGITANDLSWVLTYNGIEEKTIRQIMQTINERDGVPYLICMGKFNPAIDVNATRLPLIDYVLDKKWIQKILHECDQFNGKVDCCAIDDDPLSILGQLTFALEKSSKN